MHQDRGRGEETKQNQDRRLRPMQAQGENQQQHHQPLPPQKCPRCESLNTKFCYYNNYSLSQPRYFCKTCRRYWTQGGTLRNVPVGGGCRKGKRTKTSSSSSSGEISSRMSQQNLATPQSMISASPGATADRINKESGNLVSSTPAGISSMGSYYNAGGGFLSSLAAIQSLSNQPPESFPNLSQAANLGADLGGTASNLGILHGFNALIPSFGSTSTQQHQPRQFYEMGSGRENKSMDLFYPFDESLIRPSSIRPGGNSSSSSQLQQQNWQQVFPSNANPMVSDGGTALWSISTTTTAGGNTNNNSIAAAGAGSSSSLNPEQWPDLPGYGPPP